MNVAAPHDDPGPMYFEYSENMWMVIPGELENVATFEEIPVDLCP